MTDEFLSGLTNRLKSPVFGYYLIAALLINWDSIFYMIVDDGSAESRIAYVRENSTVWRTIIYPLSIAVGYVLLNPWFQFFITKYSVKPVTLKSHVQIQSEHDLLIKKQELENTRNELEIALKNRLETKEEELIARAKRDEELKNISDEDARETVKQELEKLRAEAEKSLEYEVSTTRPEKLDDHEVHLLMKIASLGGDAPTDMLRDGWPLSPIRFDYYLDRLNEKRLVDEKYSYEGNLIGYTLTREGRDFLVEHGYH